jgi:hypothetical protein
MQPTSRMTDIAVALGLGAAVLAATFLRGDPLYVGRWYYAVTWVGLVGIVQLARVPPLFSTGASAALATSFLLYWAWQASLAQPDGLLGLGHLVSLPGLVLAALIAAIAIRRRRLSAAATFGIALLSCCAGFALAQTIACRSVMYCGTLSGMGG